MKPLKKAHLRALFILHCLLQFCMAKHTPSTPSGHLGQGNNPAATNRSDHIWVPKNSSLGGGTGEVKGRGGHNLSAAVSFGIPDTMPNLCDECQKPGGHCGVGLKCICHPKECKDKLISGNDGSFKSLGTALLSLLAISLFPVAV